MKNVYFKNVVRSPGKETQDLITIEGSATDRKYSIYNTSQPKEICPCAYSSMIKSAKKSGAREVAKSSSRRTCPCRSPTRSSAKMPRANSANGSTRGSTNAPNADCKIEKRIPRSNSEIRNRLTIENTLSCQNISTFAPFGSSAQLDQFSKNLMETDKVVKVIKDEIVQVKHQLHHVLQNQIRSAPPNNKIPCRIKVPSVPIDYSNYLTKDGFQRLKQEIDQLNREKEDVEADKKMVEKSWNDIIEANTVVSSYDKKVGLLHTQIYKTLNAMEWKKDMICECIEEKDEKIRSLEESHLKMARLLEEKNNVFKAKEMERDVLYVNSATIKENNDHLNQTIDSLRQQLSDSRAEKLKQKENNHKLKKDLSDVNCVCLELISKTKKEKKRYESQIKSLEVELEELTSKTGQLSEKLLKADQEKMDLKNKCQELQANIQQYEGFARSFKQLESDCKTERGTMSETLKLYDKEKKDMKKLIEELNSVVEQKNIALARITELNKEQESLIKSQSVALLSKEDQLKVIKNKTEDCKIKNECLAKEMEELKKNFLEPGNREVCSCISKELAEIRYALDAEKATHLDQLRSINCKTKKLPELKKAQSGCQYLELETKNMNDKLIKKHQGFDARVGEKEILIEKRRILNSQEIQLSEEIQEFEELLCEFQLTCGYNENERELLKNLEQQLNEHKQDWNKQNQLMTQGKEKTACAAGFATQTFLDTIEEFGRQVKGRKKIESLLIKMLREKHEQLELVRAKITNITNITKDNIIFTTEASVKELYFNKIDSTLSFKHHANGETSKYSSCSSFVESASTERSKVLKSSDAACYSKHCSAVCGTETPITKTASGNIEVERNG